MYFYLSNSDAPLRARFDFERQFPKLGFCKIRSAATANAKEKAKFLRVALECERTDKHWFLTFVNQKLATANRCGEEILTSLNRDGGN
jgi:hypothetical protein